MGIVRNIASFNAALIYRPGDDIGDEYHKWWYGTKVWHRTKFLGVTCMKSPMDMWIYQEILTDLRPGLVIEFGSCYGGSALFFATMMRGLGAPFRVLSVDINQEPIDDRARRDPDVEFLESSSTEPIVADRIKHLKADYPGPAFAILDSLHTKDHVLDEMRLLRPLLTAGDYLIVEDSNINGHPVVPGWGPGPYEAIEAYDAEFPDDYEHDRERESKFGWTCAPNGFLIRR
jgi:cephalosporin hydroxylase